MQDCRWHRWGLLYEWANKERHTRHNTEEHWVLAHFSIKGEEHGWKGQSPTHRQKPTKGLEHLRKVPRANSQGHSRDSMGEGYKLQVAAIQFSSPQPCSPAKESSSGKSWRASWVAQNARACVFLITLVARRIRLVVPKGRYMIVNCWYTGENANLASVGFSIGSLTWLRQFI